MGSLATGIWVTWESAAAKLFNSVSSSWLSRNITPSTYGVQVAVDQTENAKGFLPTAAAPESAFCRKSHDWECLWLSELLLLPQPLKLSVKSKLVSRLLGEEDKNSDNRGPEKEPGTCPHFCIQMTFPGIAGLIKKN